MTNPTAPTHGEYAEEATAAGRAGAWPQSAALWRRAAEVLRRDEPRSWRTDDLYEAYLAAARRCDIVAARQGQAN